MADIAFEFAGVFQGASGDALSNPPSLQFGLDGPLNVSEQTGSVKAFTVEEQDGTWVATQSETLVDANGDELVRNIQSHFDDGTLKDDGNRQVTGIKVAGTEDEPILYISSSDPSIANRGEVNLDTNSGVLSRATLDSETGERSVVDLARGLPRSEENHAVNGIELSEDGEMLLLQVGGSTNTGGASNFFSFANEYALGGSVLEIDLAAIDQMPILTDADGGQNGTARDYVYDLPTLDDPNFENVTDGVGEDEFGMGENGPFGGNDGLNQAILPAGAPVSIYATGLRNAYDIAETPNGNLFTVDNGSKTNLGGPPNTENGDADGDGIAGEAIAGINTTPLGESEPLFQLVEGGHYYHANPLLSNQNQSWKVYDNNGNPDTTLAVNFVGDISDLVPEGLDIADGFLIDPSQIAYAPGLTLADVSAEDAQARLELAGIKIDRDLIVQSDPDGDGQGQQVIATVGSSTNGLVSYDSGGQAFDGALDGRLITAQFNGNVTLLNINDDGTALDPILNSGADGIFGNADDQVQDADGILSVANSSNGASLSVPLDVTVGPNGTLWIAEIGSGEITVVRPSTEITDTNTDADGDGIANVDDLFVRDADNGTDVVVSGNETLLWDFESNQDGNRPG